jgi:hypothetical protein
MALIRPEHVQEIVAKLRGVAGVERVYADTQAQTIVVLCAAAPDSPPPEPVARALLASHPRMKQYRLEVGYTEPVESPRRVRLCGVTTGPGEPGQQRARVVLEWQGRQTTGRGDAPTGSVGTIRAVGEATLRALMEIVDNRVTFQLTGAKTSRVYDEEIVLVLVHTALDPAAPLVGVASAGTSIEYAAARAVLGACNRLLGNYLETTD